VLEPINRFLGTSESSQSLFFAQQGIEIIGMTKLVIQHYAQGIEELGRQVYLID
jgi:hypothetical protein